MTTAPSAVTFGSFTISRLMKASPARVFAAWATPEGKQAWFTAPSSEWQQVERRFDFRVGGNDVLTGKWKSGVVTHFSSTYRDIIPGQRIVFVYDMLVDGKKISVSMVTIEFRAEGEGTRMVMNEQDVFLDGYADHGAREHGTTAQIDLLEKTLESDDQAYLAEAVSLASSACRSNAVPVREPSAK